MPRRGWEAMETGTGKVWLAEAKGRRGKRGSREKTGRAGNEKEEGEENSRDKKNSREMGDLGRGGSSKVGRGSEEIGTQAVSLMD